MRAHRCLLLAAVLLGHVTSCALAWAARCDHRLPPGVAGEIARAGAPSWPTVVERVLQRLAATDRRTGRSALAAGERGQEAVEKARRALSDSSFPWYDPEEDELRPMEVEAEEEAARHRTSDWLQKRSSRNWNLGWQGLLYTLLNLLAWGLLLVLLAALTFLLVRALLRREARASAAASNAGGADDVVSDADRVENLPFEIERPQGDLLEETRRCYKAGDFRKAVIYLYSYQLVHLDRHQIIHLARGKTNRQYLRELRWRPELSHMLEKTMLAFEDVFFGAHTLDQAQFEACWTQLEAFHSQVQEIAEQATAA